MNKILLKNAKIVSKNLSFTRGDVLIVGDTIDQVAVSIATPKNATVIDCSNFTLTPGIIDSQVHFRGPGQMEKEDLFTGSKAAIAGGVTSVNDQPNTNPPITTAEKWYDRHARALRFSLVNYSMNFGVSNENQDEISALVENETMRKYIPGFKIFAGSSTGNMLVNMDTIYWILENHPDFIKIFHSEEEEIIRKNLAYFKQQVEKGKEVEHARIHQHVRPNDACYSKTKKIVDMARKLNSRAHIYHISTGAELDLFDTGIPVKNKLITAEACLPHIVFDNSDYELFGNLIKCNPSVKTPLDKSEIRQAIRDGLLDVICTDHAPHELEKKKLGYFAAPSGIPSVGENPLMMLDLVEEGVFTIEQVVNACCHNQADLFGIQKRGYIKEGYKADIALFEKTPWTLDQLVIHSKCGWSPFTGRQFTHTVRATIVNGVIGYSNFHGKQEFNFENRGTLLTFDR